MFIGKMGALLVGASPLALAAAPESKDDSALFLEIKREVDKLVATITEFRTKNDESLSQKFKDVVTTEQVDRINAAIEEQKTAIQKRID